MFRIFLTVVLPVLAPFLLYMLYVTSLRRRAAEAGRPLPGWRDLPWLWLMVIGLLLLTVTLATVRFTTGLAPGEPLPPLVIEGQERPSPFPVQ